MEACVLVSDILEVAEAAGVRHGALHDMFRLIARIARAERADAADSRALCRHIALLLTRYFGRRAAAVPAAVEPSSVRRLRTIVYENIESII